LLQAIHDRIAQNGFVTVAEYMNLCAEAYYARGNVFGREGDFVTAPEISQAFGEIIGLWCAVTWRQMGQPDAFRFVECGPGRGTLIADALRATKRIAGFHAAAEMHLVERSEGLRAAQCETLGDIAVQWHAELSTVPAGPMIVIANEFLDALPIRQFQHTAEGWTERVIVRSLEGSLAFSTRSVNDAPVPIALAATAEIGAVFERSDAVVGFTRALAARLAAQGGAGLLIDYGHAASALGETLQAVKAHR
jgi:SAM-dependent MidA family methyltransferase